MYEKLKNVIRLFVPPEFLFRNELLIRKVYSLFYSGNTFQCNICEKKLSHFVLNFRSEKTCPKCGSLERDRKLWKVVSNEFLKAKISILDFSPSRSLVRKFKTIAEINYVSTDFCGNFIADFQYDITNLNIPNATFDLICCYHILEHVENDSLAISELYRVLKQNGIVIIQTPFKDGEIYESQLITAESERFIHFGQKDHVRIYSETGLANRLELSGFDVEIRHYIETENNYNGFSKIETQIIAKKIN